MRAWIADSTWGRAIGLTLLVLFVVVCGLHFAGAHHDSDLEGLGVVDSFGMFSILALLLLATTIARMGPQATSLHATYGQNPLVRARGGPLPCSSIGLVPLRR